MIADACDPAPTVSFEPAALGLGTTSVTATARDATGNTSTTTFDVTVVDTTPTVFTVVPEDIERHCEEDGVLVSFDALAEDLSGAAPIACEDEDGAPVDNAGTRFGVGDHTVTCTATDSSSNTATWSFRVTVIDDDVPVIVLPDDITVGTEPGECFAFVEFTVTATDACDSDAGIVCEALWGPVESGDAFPIGTTAVTCTARDHSGNEATGSFHITVVDREAPVIVCPETATIVMDGSCATCKGSKSCRCGRCDSRRHGKARKPRAKCGGATTVTVTAADLGVAVTDNCDPDPVVLVSPSELRLGTHTVTVTATDDDGNTSSCTITVTVLRPPLDCQILRPLDGNVDNRIRARQTIPIGLKVTCDNVAVRDATVTIDEVTQVDAQGSPVANDAGDEDADADAEFHLHGDRYHRNLSTSDWDDTRGARYEVLLRIERSGHAGAFCSVFFVVR